MIDASSIGSPPLHRWSPSTLGEAVAPRTTPNSLRGKHHTSWTPPSPPKKMDLKKKKKRWGPEEGIEDAASHGGLPL